MKTLYLTLILIKTNIFIIQTNQTLHLGFGTTHPGSYTQGLYGCPTWRDQMIK